MALHNQFGAHGELLARKYLLENGHQILEQNWRYKRSEIDIISTLNDTIIFTEVKTRRSNTFGEPEDFIDATKLQQMEWAAEEYIEQMDHHGEVRFDVISILFDSFNNHTIHHIDDAFWPE
ncbi:MAG: YraN family protein [Chitinophagaceae bacterium]|nr:MAG: YraN family protein [Chitinophagaceae bacterium]